MMRKSRFPYFRYLPAGVAFLVVAAIWQVVADHTQSIIPTLGSIYSALGANSHLPSPTASTRCRNRSSVSAPASPSPFSPPWR